MSGPRITIRLRSVAERQALERAAGKEPVSQWARRVLLATAGVPTDEPPEAERARRMRRGERDPWEVALLARADESGETR